MSEEIKELNTRAVPSDHDALLRTMDERAERLKPPPVGDWADKSLDNGDIVLDAIKTLMPQLIHAKRFGGVSNRERKAIETLYKEVVKANRS